MRTSKKPLIANSLLQRILRL